MPTDRFGALSDCSGDAALCARGIDEADVFGPLLPFGFLRGYPASGRLARRLMNTFG